MTDDRMREEDALAVFFDAARVEAQHPRTAHLSAILGDAAAISAARKAPPARRRRWTPFGRVSDIPGGWGGAVALAGCAALGVWAGLGGAGSDLAGAALWSDATGIAASDGVSDFFDLAATEG